MNVTDSCVILDAAKSLVDPNKFSGMSDVKKRFYNRLLRLTD
jgi:hypothetical protein